MAFGKKKVQGPPLTTAELIERHQQLAEAQLARANRAGRLEAQTVFATRATAHATLAVSYLLAPPPGELPDVEEADD